MQLAIDLIANGYLTSNSVLLKMNSVVQVGSVSVFPSAQFFMKRQAHNRFFASCFVFKGTQRRNVSIQQRVGTVGVLELFISQDCFWKYKKDRLSESQINKLDAIGFDWNPREIRDNRTWEEKFEALVAFKEKHGHVGVTLKQDEQLANRVSNQKLLKKAGVLKKTHGKKLDAIGFEWIDNVDRGRQSSDTEIRHTATEQVQLLQPVQVCTPVYSLYPHCLLNQVVLLFPTITPTKSLSMMTEQEPIYQEPEKHVFHDSSACHGVMTTSPSTIKAAGNCDESDSSEYLFI
jgi:hypothetical protein